MGKLGTGGTGATDVLRDCGPSSRTVDVALVIACPRLPDENGADTLRAIRESLHDIRDQLDDALDLVGLLLQSHEGDVAGSRLKVEKLVPQPSRLVDAEPSPSKCLTCVCDSKPPSLAIQYTRSPGRPSAAGTSVRARVAKTCGRYARSHPEPREKFMTTAAAPLSRSPVDK